MILGVVSHGVVVPYFLLSLLIVILFNHSLTQLQKQQSFFIFVSYLQQQDSMASDRAKTFVQPVVPRFDGQYNY